MDTIFEMHEHDKFSKLENIGHDFILMKFCIL